MSMITVKNLKKSFGDHEVLKDINAVIEEKEVVCVIGPSGSGKSTFLRCLNKLEDITAGEVVVHGHTITDPKVNINKVRQEVGMVFQHFNLFPHKTVLENITIAPMKVKGADKKAAVDKAIDLLEKVGLKDKAKSYLTNYLVDKNSVSPLQEPWQWTRKCYYSMNRHLLLTLKSSGMY